MNNNSMTEAASQPDRVAAGGGAADAPRTTAAAADSSSATLDPLNTTHLLLRQLFPDRSAVMIYPDDFYHYYQEEGGCGGEETETETETAARSFPATTPQLSPKHQKLSPLHLHLHRRLNKDLSIPELIDRHSGHFSDRRVAILLRPPPARRRRPPTKNPPPPPPPKPNPASSMNSSTDRKNNDNNNNNIYHDLHVPVGYWTQVLGLGATPSQIKLTGTLGVYAVPANTANTDVGSLDTFWRSCENITSQTSFVWDPTTRKWCVPVNKTATATATTTATTTTTSTNDAPVCTSYSTKHTTTTTTTTPQNTELIPVGDLTDPEWGYPPDEIPPSSFDPSRGMLWAVSQAAPLRRICIDATTTTTDDTAEDDDADAVGGSGSGSRGSGSGSGKGGPTLHLSLGPNCASGGYMSNCFVRNGYVSFGSQQQWCCRNSTIGHKAAGGAWSFVLVGCDSGNNTTNKNNNSQGGGGDGGRNSKVKWATKPGLDLPLISDESTTPVRIEKPFLFIDRKDGDGSSSSSDDDEEMLFLGIPATKHNSVGADHRPMSDNERVRIFVGEHCDVKVVTPDDPFDEIQSAVHQGKHLVLNPGTYCWEQTLCLSPTTERQVILGIGMATIQAPSIYESCHRSSCAGRPCIYVPSTSRGVRISGISLEASRITDDDSDKVDNNYEGSCLLQWGDPPTTTTTTNLSSDPPSWDRPSGAIHDLYCFVGGRSLDRRVSVETMVKIYSSHVVGDNLWLWRADHVKLKPGEQPNRPELSEYHVTTYGECRCDVGLEVYGDNVIMYGLAVEHTYKNMVQWYGHHGSVYFYQSELPYDVSGDVYNQSGAAAVAGYKVHNTAHYHTAKGVGVYSYFRDYDDVDVPSGVCHEATTGRYENIFTVWLNGYEGLKSVINGRGDATRETGKPYIVPVYISGASYWGTGLVSAWSLKLTSRVFPTADIITCIIDRIRNVFSSAWKQLRSSMASSGGAKNLT